MANARPELAENQQQLPGMKRSPRTAEPAATLSRTRSNKVLESLLHARSNQQSTCSRAQTRCSGALQSSSPLCEVWLQLITLSANTVAGSKCAQSCVMALNQRACAVPEDQPSPGTLIESCTAASPTLDDVRSALTAQTLRAAMHSCQTTLFACLLLSHAQPQLHAKSAVAAGGSAFRRSRYIPCALHPPAVLTMLDL